MKKKVEKIKTSGMTVFLIFTHFPIAIPNLVIDKRSSNFMSCEFFRTNFSMFSLPIDEYLFVHIIRRYPVLNPCCDYISPSRVQWQVSSRKALLFDLLGRWQPL